MPDDDELGDETLEDADEALLDSLLKPRTTTVGYVYDFGDNWELRLTLTNRRISAPNTAYPRYIGGERNAPPEDCGGVPGFHQLLDAMSDPDHPIMQTCTSVAETKIPPSLTMRRYLRAWLSWTP